MEFDVVIFEPRRGEEGRDVVAYQEAVANEWLGYLCQSGIPAGVRSAFRHQLALHKSRWTDTTWHWAARAAIATADWPQLAALATAQLRGIGVPGNNASHIRAQMSHNRVVQGGAPDMVALDHYPYYWRAAATAILLRPKPDLTWSRRMEELGAVEAVVASGEVERRRVPEHHLHLTIALVSRPETRRAGVDFANGLPPVPLDPPPRKDYDYVPGNHSALIKAYAGLGEYALWLEQRSVDYESSGEDVPGEVRFALLHILDLVNEEDGRAFPFLLAGLRMLDDVRVVTPDLEALSSLGPDTRASMTDRELLDAIAGELLLKFWERNPVCGPDVYRELGRRGFEEEAAGILERVAAALPPSHPLWPTWALRKLAWVQGLQKDEKGARETATEVALRMLDFLDYASAADCAEAWDLLHESLSLVPPPSPRLTKAWAERRDWWPEFHLREPLLGLKSATIAMLRKHRKMKKDSVSP